MLIKAFNKRKGKHLILPLVILAIVLAGTVMTLMPVIGGIVMPPPPPPPTPPPPPPPPKTQRKNLKNTSYIQNTKKPKIL